jgi:hypothetical protein
MGSDAEFEPLVRAALGHVSPGSRTRGSTVAIRQIADRRADQAKSRITVPLGRCGVMHTNETPYACELKSDRSRRCRGSAGAEAWAREHR